MYKEPGFSTLSVQSGEKRKKANHGITDAIHCASTFTFSDTKELIDFLENKPDRDEYIRYSNPNQNVVEAKLAALDGAEKSLLFSSGMAAICCLLLAKLEKGDEVILFDECYHRSREFSRDYLSRWGIVCKFAKTGDFAHLKAQISDRKKLIFTESPTNPHLSVIDIPQLASLAKEHQCELAVDATLATPFNLQAIRFGADYVIHSATKYLAGHNDVVAGVISGREEALESLRSLRGLLGCVSTPHNNYLLQRGLKTFALRMEQHNKNGIEVAQFLESHPKIRKVFYPGLESHSSFLIAKEQMPAWGGLLTFEIEGDRHAASSFVDQLKIPRIGPSLGGVESLVEQPLYMSYNHLSPEARAEVGITDSMIRLSLGVEDTDDLIADLKQALDIV
ncbi:MAG: aminotransferase class I/II-fold pyridoxal phosphate-dependent enzyme [Oligoflexales bacterium]|nr:aminotransferase class I/II-fold pyridoxal phosphate-dependent enzyme [Oligoflexales bacterium]